MCDPLTISAVATAALSIGSSVLEYQGTREAYAQNQAMANYNYALDRETLGRKAVELDQAKSENAVDTAIAAARAQGDIAASASEQGLSSGSIIRAVNASMFGLGRDYSAEQINDQSQRVQLAADARGAEIARRNQIAQRPKASKAGLAIGVGKGLLSGFNTFAAGAPKGA